MRRGNFVDSSLISSFSCLWIMDLCQNWELISRWSLVCKRLISILNGISSCSIEQWHLNRVEEVQRVQQLEELLKLCKKVIIDSHECDDHTNLSLQKQWRYVAKDSSVISKVRKPAVPVQHDLVKHGCEGQGRNSWKYSNKNLKPEM